MRLIVRCVVLLVCVPLVACANRAALGRTWTDKKGKQFEAELVDVKAGVARLKLESGKTVKVSLAKLSQEDQDFVQESAGAEQPPAKAKTSKGDASSADNTSSTADGITVAISGLSIIKTFGADQERSGYHALPVYEGVIRNEPEVINEDRPLRVLPEVRRSVKPENSGDADKPESDQPPTLDRQPPVLEKPVEQPTELETPFRFNFGSNRPGTTLTLGLVDEKREFVRIDDQNSKIVSCTDDTGQDLTRGGQGLDGLRPFPQFHPDRHSGLVEIEEPRTPARGATKIHLRAELIVICGIGETSAEQADVPLTTSGKITAGPVPFTIEPAKKDDVAFPFPLPFKIEGLDQQNGGPPKLAVKLTTDKSEAIVKKIIFVGAGGKEIPQRWLSSGSGAIGIPLGADERPEAPQMNYRTIGLMEAAEKATVRIVAYGKLETVKVPIDFEIGVGF